MNRDPHHRFAFPSDRVAPTAPEPVTTMTGYPAPLFHPLRSCATRPAA